MRAAGLLAATLFAMAAPAESQLDVDLYAAACTGGDWAACNVLGLMYELGQGVAHDPERAAALFDDACEGGLWIGCTNLGRLHSTGAAPAADAARAAELFRTACRAGEGLACSLLAEDDRAVREGTVDVVGRVRDALGRQGLSQARVTVGGGPAALTGPTGTFALRDVPSGPIVVEISRFGYDARSVELHVPPGRTVELVAELSAEPLELEPIEVTVRSATLERVGFYERSRRGMGTQITRVDIGQPRVRETSDAIRMIPSVHTRRVRGTTSAFSRRGQGLLGVCRLAVYVDGTRMADQPTPFDLDEIPPQAIEAIEVYHGGGAPIQYPDLRNGCGVVLLWTR